VQAPVFVPMASVPINRLVQTTATKEVDELVFSTVNAPYRRTIGAATLAGCMAKAEPGKWPVHVATFFTDISLDLVLAVAAAHGLSKSQLARTYSASKRKAGEPNANLEAKLGREGTAEGAPT
jgi:hypothetical protein